MAVVRFKDRKAVRSARRTGGRLMVPIEAQPSIDTPPADLSYVHPSHLHDLIAPAQVRVMTFHSEKAMTRYRWMLYQINKQGEFRFRTMRDEKSMWGIVIWRMQ